MDAVGRSLDDTSCTVTQQSTKEAKRVDTELYELCTGCKGEGQLACDACHCPPYQTCERCEGSSRQVCLSCGGRGKKQGWLFSRRCKYCNGSGKHTCHHCTAGRQVCKQCDGTGRRHSCSKCSGRRVYSCSACNGLGQIFSSAVRTLAGGSNDAWVVAKALAAAGDRRSVGFLERFLLEQYHFSRRRIEAAALLSGLGVPEAARPLIKLMTGDYDKRDEHDYSFHDRAPSEGAMYWFELRRVAIEAIGRLAAAAAVKPLMSLLPRSSDFSTYNLDFSLCETTISALTNIIESSQNQLEGVDLLALAEWPDCEFLGWKQLPSGDYFCKGQRQMRADCARLREAAKRALSISQ